MALHAAVVASIVAIPTAAATAAALTVIAIGFGVRTFLTLVTAPLLADPTDTGKGALSISSRKLDLFLAFPSALPTACGFGQPLNLSDLLADLLEVNCPSVQMVNYHL